VVNDWESAALLSWPLDWRVTAVLLATAAIYVRGWMRGRRLRQTAEDKNRLAAFLSGTCALFIALESPLDTFDSLFLSAHMTQHLLLMMVAPPLLLLGDPRLPLLRGLPRSLVKEGLGPFLAWPLLRKFERFITFPVVTWLAFALSTLIWHVPFFYELALRRPVWHGLQHACFFWTGILFWWPLVFPSRWPRWTAIPYLLLADGLNTAISAFFVFSDRLLYPSYAVVRLAATSAMQDQAAAGAIMWVPGSIVYLLPAVAIAMRLITHKPQLPRRAKPAAPPSKTQDLQWLRWRFRLPSVRRAAQVAMLLVAIAVMADGFFGRQIAPLNLAGTLPWIHWRALSILALLVVGNLFCMACPFTLVRDWGRKLLPATLRWPRRLRNKWLPAGLIVIYLWSYEAFSLWNSPWITAWIIAGYFLTAVLIDGFFRGASFCKYVCPIGQFHFIASLISPREIRVRSIAACQSCRTYDCIRGNSQSRGCELDLFQPKKVGNLDCTFCLDCVQACPHDNVALLPVVPASTLTIDPYRSSLRRLSKRTDIAALALLIVFGAFVNAAGMTEPVLMWEHGWHARLGSMPLITGIFIFAGVVIMPAAAVLLCAQLNKLARIDISAPDAARRCVLALTPVGIAMWAAHLLFHWVSAWTVHMSSMPPWLIPVQILLLDAGLLLTLYLMWRTAGQTAASRTSAVTLLAPWATVSCGLYVAGVWVLFQPMQMRGMVQ
jgi:cytochrome c oxidase assembly factor CtaG